ncbi:MAG: hypothetical protein ISP90_01730 [Nevskia sp.]|nr:hypothetical protein [Nevskia sp.]
MTLFRLLILAGLAWFVWRVLQSWGNDAPPRAVRRPGPEDYEKMARCLGCGVHLPRGSLGPDGRCRSCQPARKA